MNTKKMIGKREFIQHTSRYLKWIEKQDRQLIITHHNKPDLIIIKIKNKTFDELRAHIEIKIHDDINEPVLPGYNEW